MTVDNLLCFYNRFNFVQLLNIRHLWQLKIAVSAQCYLIFADPLTSQNIFKKAKKKRDEGNIHKTSYDRIICIYIKIDR